MAITQEKNIEMLEKLADGNFKIKYPKTKKEQVIGIENIQNYGIATQAEALAGTSNVKYMTPLRVKDVTGNLTINDIKFSMPGSTIVAQALTEKSHNKFDTESPKNLLTIKNLMPGFYTVTGTGRCSSSSGWVRISLKIIDYRGVVNRFTLLQSQSTSNVNFNYTFELPVPLFGEISVTFGNASSSTYTSYASNIKIMNSIGSLPSMVINTAD